MFARPGCGWVWCRLALSAPRRQGCKGGRRETFIRQEAGESPNDRNDRAIRVAAAWYGQRLPGMEVVLLSNDVDNRNKAAAAGIEALSVQARGPSPVSAAPAETTPIRLPCAIGCH